MSRSIGYLAAVLLPLMLFPFSTAHADTYIAFNALYCSSDEDVIQMAEARSKYVLRDLMEQKIQSGVCAPGPNKKVGVLLKRITPRKGIPYYCFKEQIEKEKLSDLYSCVLASHITTFERQVETRIGDHTSVRQLGNFYKVDCTEGGTITVEKRDNQYFRISNVFELTMRVPDILPTPAGKDFDRAVRDGCRGVDYLLNQTSFSN